MPKIKISISTASLYPRELSTSLELIEELSVNSLELMPQDFTECSIEYIAPKFERHPDLQVSSIHYPLILWGFFANPYPVAQQTGEEISENLVQLAQSLGTKTIVIHSLTEKDNFEPRTSTMKNQTRKFLDLCDQAGVEVAIENIAHSVTDHPEKMENYISKLNRSKALPMLDTTETLETGIKPTDFLNSSLPITHFHLSDYGKGKVHLPIGEGEINWTKTLQAIKNKGEEKELNLVVEIAYRYLLKDARTKLKRSLDRIKKEIL